jgi:hypothetical protein
MPPIRLTDAQLDVIMAAAEPLAVADRDPFALWSGLKGMAQGCFVISEKYSDLRAPHVDA